MVAIVAIAAVLRLATLTSQSFWIDEATTVHEVGLSFGGMLHAIAHNEATPPLYFALGWVWSRVFGAGELGIRSLSAVLGVGTVFLCYLCGRELASRAAGCVAAAFAAVSPFMVWYSQEARSYMLLAFLSALSIWCWALAVRTGRRGAVAAWSAAASLALATHFFAALLVVPEALWLLHRRRTRTVAVAVLGVALVELALLPLAITDASHPLDEWISGLPLSNRIEQIPFEFGLSQLYRGGHLGVALPVTAALAALVGGLLWRARATPAVMRGAGAAGALAAIVILVPVAAALAGVDYLFARNLAPGWIPLAVVIAIACTAAPGRWDRALGGVLVAVLVIAMLWGEAVIAGDSVYQRPDWRGVAQALGAPHGTRAIVTYDGNAAEQPLAIYLPGSGFSYSGVPAAGPAERFTEVDVVGDTGMTVPRSLPSGVTHLAERYVGTYLVERFRIAGGWTSTPAALAARAPSLLGPGTQTVAVLVQHAR